MMAKGDPSNEEVINWSERDEIKILEGIVTYSDSLSPSHEYINGVFYESIRGSFTSVVTEPQLFNKIRDFRRNYNSNLLQGNEIFTDQHEQEVYNLSHKIWDIPEDLDVPRSDLWKVKEGGVEEVESEEEKKKKKKKKKSKEDDYVEPTDEEKSEKKKKKKKHKDKDEVGSPDTEKSEKKKKKKKKSKEDGFVESTDGGDADKHEKKKKKKNGDVEEDGEGRKRKHKRKMDDCLAGVSAKKSKVKEIMKVKKKKKKHKDKDEVGPLDTEKSKE